MDSSSGRELTKMIEYPQRGWLTVREAASRILFYVIDAPHVAEYLEAIPDAFRHELASLLQTLPVLEEEWVRFRKVAQLDGDEFGWARMVVKARANTEAARTYLFGGASPPTSADFEERIRSADRTYMQEFDRNRFRRPDERVNHA